MGAPADLMKGRAAPSGPANGRRQAVVSREPTPSSQRGYLSPIFRRHPDAIGLATFPEGRILDVNDVFAATAGHRPAEVIGRRILEIDLWMSAEQRAEILAELDECGSVTGREIESKSRDGSTRTGLASVDLIDVDGERCSLWVLHDITDQRRTEAELRDRTLELETLLAIATTLGATTDLDVTLETIAHRAAKALGCPEVEIVEYDAETDVLRAAAIYQAQPTAYAEALGRPVTGAEADLHKQLMARRTCTVQAADDPDLDAVTRELMTRRNDRVYVRVPLRFGAERLGLLVFIETERDRRFSERELALAAAVGEQAALAIHTGRQFERERGQNRRLAALVEASRALASELDLEGMMSELARVATDALDADWCSVYEHHPEDGTVTEAAIYERAGAGHPRMVGRTYRISTDLPVVEGDYPLDVDKLGAGEVLVEQLSDPGLDAASRADMEAQGEKSCLTVPLTSGGTMVGFFVVIHGRTEHAFTAQEVEVARAIGEHATVAWERARLYQRLELLAITDGLTGVFNHRHFYDRLGNEIKRSDRYGATLPMLMIDIDGFKLFNDRYGHQAGDDALRQIAGILSADVREGVDLVARYGGEEFAVLLPGSQDAVAAAERIREHVRAATMETPLGDAGLTVSIGLAAYPDSAADMDDLVARADAAMYIAKRLGKDRVEVAGRR